VEDERQPQGSSEFGSLLRRYRVAAGLSQEALAERAHMSTNGIGALERGYRRAPYRETLALLAEGLALGDQERRAFEDAAARSSPRRLIRDPARGDADVNHEVSNLPVPLTSFVGRDDELKEIADLLRDYRLVTLTGTGGIGKTRASLQVATDMIGTVRDGVWLVELAPLTAGEYVPTTLAQALRLTLAGADDPIENLVRAIKPKQMLLVFDNCEHLLDPVARLISAILRGCPKIKALASSRQGLGIDGEAIYPMPSLSVPAAISLFNERAGSFGARFGLPDENEPVVSDICRRLDGIPLAIELAAARLKMLSPKQLRERLDERFRVLTGGDRSALPRHQTMRALIDGSHDLLDDRERALFRRLGIFADGFALEGAVAVGSGDGLEELDVFDVLASLVDKSMVLAEPHGDSLRYRLLQSTRAYALEKLGDADERDRVAGRHLRYLRDHFAQLRARVERTARGSDLVAALQTELEDVRCALDWALTRTDIVDGSELLANIRASWQVIGLEAEGIARRQACLAALPADQLRLHARLSTELSYALAESGHKARALEVATQAVDHARASGDSPLLAEALRQYASAATLLRHFDDAESALRQAESIPGTSAELRVVLIATRASLSNQRGDRETAARMYEELRKEHRTRGNTRGDLIAVLNLADTEHARGRTERAISLVRETLPTARSGAYNNVLAHLLHNLAAYLIAVEDLSGAAAAAREAIGIHTAAREPHHAKVAVSVEHLALVFALRGDLVRAATLAGYADASFERHGFQREFTETTTYGRLTALLREGLATGDFARLAAEGATLTPEAAIALALDGRVEIA
jgi:predicted ATPase/DNA-binding XRE family transcriptional regulator